MQTTVFWVIFRIYSMRDERLKIDCIKPQTVVAIDYHLHREQPSPKLRQGKCAEKISHATASHNAPRCALFVNEPGSETNSFIHNPFIAKLPFIRGYFWRPFEALLWRVTCHRPSNAKRRNNLRQLREAFEVPAKVAN